jgi:hypothetical protein
LKFQTEFPGLYTGDTPTTSAPRDVCNMTFTKVPDLASVEISDTLDALFTDIDKVFELEVTIGLTNGIASQVVRCWSRFSVCS